MRSDFLVDSSQAKMVCFREAVSFPSSEVFKTPSRKTALRITLEHLNEVASNIPPHLRFSGTGSVGIRT